MRRVCVEPAEAGSGDAPSATEFLEESCLIDFETCEAGGSAVFDRKGV